jgi:NCS1 family nucleobase:cation symporter-1
MGVVRRLTQAIEIPHDSSLTLAQQLITVSMPFALQQYRRITVPVSISALKNEDLLPVVPENRTWRGYNYVALCV